MAARRQDAHKQLRRMTGLDVSELTALRARNQLRRMRALLAFLNRTDPTLDDGLPGRDARDRLLAPALAELGKLARHAAPGPRARRVVATTKEIPMGLERCLIPAHPHHASGCVIGEDPEETARGKQGPIPNGHAPFAGLDAELASRKRQRADAQATARAAWLETSGFGALVTQAQAALAAVPRARDERARAMAEHTATFEKLAAGIEQLLVPREFTREIEALRLRGDVYARENEAALRALMTRVLSADLADVNGPVKNPNTATAWRRRFQELMPHLPRPGWSVEHRTQVHALIARVQAARRGTD